MSKSITANAVIKNINLSIIAQIISLAMSFVVNLVVPKFILEYDYALWQTFLLYASFVGVLHFGLLDGLLLRYSQFDYDELDKKKMRSQFNVLLLITGVVAIIICVVSFIFARGEYKTIFFLVGVAVLIKNAFAYTSYSFQMTNRINKYAVCVIFERCSYCLFMMLIVLMNKSDFRLLCLADISATGVAFIAGFFMNKGMYFGKIIPITEVLNETKLNVFSGVMLMVSNLTAMLIVGGAKLIIGWRFKELVYGKVAFAFALTNMFLTFISAISIVLFPSLKRLDETLLETLYKKIRNLLSPLLVVVLLFYFIGAYVVNLWLPKYSQSLTALAIILPIVMYSSKVSLLTNNYLKAYRKERLMLFINLASVLIGLIAFIVSAFVLGDLNFVLYSVVAVVALNAIASEIVVIKINKESAKSYIFHFVIEAIISVLFIVISLNFSLLNGALIYLAVILIYLLIDYKNIVNFIKQIKLK